MIRTIRKGELEYLSADGIGVPHAFTTRLGGVSRDQFSSLNIGFGRGDREKAVLENFRILGDALGFTPEQAVKTHQTHTDIVRVVTGEDGGTGVVRPEFPDCDALITRTPGLALVISTADCTPILLYDPVTGAVGAAHAGWRGTAADIGGKTVAAMVRNFGCDPADLRAAIGPNIGPCCFETDADVPRALLEAFGEEVSVWIRPEKTKFYVNLKEINALALRRAGVKYVEISTACTACEPDRFWSHRITRGNRGSQGAVIVCGEVRA